MSGVNFKVVRVQLPSGPTANVDFTVPGFGTPKAAMFFFAANHITGTSRPGGRISMGFTDGVNQACCSSASEDAQATSNTARSSSVTSCVQNVYYDGSIVDHVGSFNSWITDGVRLSFTNLGGNAYSVMCVLINGDDVLNATVGDFHNDAISESVTLGYEPSILFPMSIGRATQESVTRRASMQNGCVVNDGSNTQRSTAMRSQDSLTTTLVGTARSIVSGLLEIDHGAITNTADISFSPTGFTFDNTISPLDKWTYYLALEFSPGTQVAIFDYEWPEAGTLSVAGVGFEPTFAFMHDTQSTPTPDLHLNTGNVFNYMAVAFDAANMASLNITDRTAQTDSQCKSLSDIKVNRVWVGGGDNAIVSTGWSFTSDGFDITTSNTSDIFRGWGLAIGIVDPGVNKIFHGGTPIQALSIGGTPISEVFVGSIKVFG